jgi:hypothetical protein
MLGQSYAGSEKYAKKHILTIKQLIVKKTLSEKHFLL